MATGEKTWETEAKELRETVADLSKRLDGALSPKDAEDLKAALTAAQTELRELRERQPDNSHAEGLAANLQKTIDTLKTELAEIKNSIPPKRQGEEDPQAQKTTKEKRDWV